jgi:hypothetical protein
LHRVQSPQHVRLRQAAKCSIAAFGAFEDFVGDVPTNPVVLGPIERLLHARSRATSILASVGESKLSAIMIVSFIEPQQAWQL